MITEDRFHSIASAIQEQISTLAEEVARLNRMVTEQSYQVQELTVGMAQVIQSKKAK